MALVLYCVLFGIATAAAIATDEHEVWSEEVHAAPVFDQSDELYLMQLSAIETRARKYVETEGAARMTFDKSGDPSQRNAKSSDRVVHLFNFSDTLQKEVEQFSDIAITVSGVQRGCINHFFHTMINLVIPIFAKMILPFVSKHKKLPRRRIHVPNLGGTSSAALLQQMIPGFDFVNAEWIPYCWQNTTCIDTAPRHRLDIPILTLHSDWMRPYWGELYINGVEATTEQRSFHKHIIMEFRSYVLKHAPSVPSGFAAAPKRLFLSRNSEAKVEVPLRIGKQERGAEKRDIANEKQVVQALNDTIEFRTGDAQGITMLHLEGKPFMEQVAIHSQAKLLVAQHGAGLLHCLWMPEGSAVVEIATPMVSGRRIFEIICQRVRGLHYRRLFVPDASDDPDLGNNVTVPTEELIDAAGDFLGATLG